MRKPDSEEKRSAVGAPVAFFVFNRPELTAVSFARIRDHQPQELFVIADGPRADHATDRQRCAEVRAVVSRIDWPCDVRHEFADENMGLKNRLVSGLDWVFSQTDRAIILEDDCIAHPDFFDYCESLLTRYEDDTQVAMVTGDNFQRGRHRGVGAYYFSKYTHIWGWATWRRAWRNYDVAIPFWSAWKSSNDWQDRFQDPMEREYWERVFDGVSGEDADTWDYQWLACTWFHGGLTATPNSNLVSNGGFGPDATHTTGSPDWAALPTGPLGTLVHPLECRQDVAADRFVFDHHFGGAVRRQRTTYLGRMAWLVTGSLRVARRKLRALLR